jgi:GT2 family glycosyltransferase
LESKILQNTAIVILNWNGKQFLADFLPTLIKYSDSSRIVVADNASSDDSLSFLKENFPQVEIVLNQENGGFAKGYNDALKQIDAEYYLLINSDIEVSENWLLPLCKEMEDAQVAAVQPKILSYYKKDYFEHAGASGGFIDKNYFPFCRGRIFNAVEQDSAQYDGGMEVFWTSGACMLVRADIYHQLNGFDEDFFAHMEEIDLCWRMKRLGYSLKVQPASKVYHVGGGTLNYESPNKTYLNFRNNLFMITKNYQGILFFKLFYRLSLDGLAGIQHLVKGKYKFCFAIIKAHGSFYKMLPKMLKKRKEFSPDKQSFNKNGFYKGSILWAFYFKKIKKFADLNMRFFSDY